MITSTVPATEPQLRYVRTLLHERELDAEVAERLRERIAAGTLDKTTARLTIDWLKRQPYAAARVASPVAEPSTGAAPTAEAFDPQSLEIGIYELNGKIYKIKLNQDKTRRYALELTYDVGEIERLTAAGGRIKAEYVYARGVIYDLRPEHRITGQRAEELMIVFENCLVCGRHLKAAESVERAIGPVCWKRNFRH